VPRSLVAACRGRTGCSLAPHLALDQRAIEGADGGPRKIDPDQLSYQLIRPRQLGLADVVVVGEAYRCWSEVWSQTLLELAGDEHVPSDQFTRQDEVGAIFHGYECISLSCFRWVDLSLAMELDDSYFDCWPEEARRAAVRDGTRVCVASNFTISPAWRRVPDYSLRKIGVAMTLDRFLAAGDGTAMLGTMRDDRGMGKLIEQLGATRLGSSVRHGVPVTLIALYRDALRTSLDSNNESIVRLLGRHLVGGLS
jgi:hypothetical protein